MGFLRQIDAGTGMRGLAEFRGGGGGGGPFILPAGNSETGRVPIGTG